MTRGEGMELLDRYVHAGYRQPAEMAEAFDEWYQAFANEAIEDVSAAIGRLIKARTSSFWPTPGELMEHVRAVTGGRVEADAKCAPCHGSGWLEAAPYRANGGVLYENVARRCPDCGKPAPNLQHLAGHHTPLTASELREWATKRSRTGGPTTRAEFAVEMAAIAKRMAMPKMRLVERAGEDE